MSSQDRESYSDDQDRESYYVSDAHEVAAGEHGWTEYPDGRWWREIQEGETVHADEIAPFLGSGPFLWADSAEAACERDGILVDDDE